MKKLILVTAIAIILIATSVNAQTISAGGKTITLSKNQIAWIVSHYPQFAQRFAIAFKEGARTANTDTADMIMAIVSKMPKTVK